MKRDFVIQNKELGILAIIISLCLEGAGVLNKKIGFFIVYAIFFLIINLYCIVINRKNKKNNVSLMKKTCRYVMMWILLIPVAVMIQVAVRGFGQYDIIIYKSIYEFLDKIFPNDFLGNYQILIFLAIVCDIAHYYEKKETLIGKDIYEIFSTISFGIIAACIVSSDVIAEVNCIGVICFSIISVGMFILISRKNKVGSIALITGLTITVTFCLIHRYTEWNPLYIIISEIIIANSCIQFFLKSK